MKKLIVTFRNNANSPNTMMAKWNINLAFGIIATEHCSWTLKRNIKYIQIMYTNVIDPCRLWVQNYKFSDCQRLTICMSGIHMVFLGSTGTHFFPLRSTQHRCLKIIFFRVPVSLRYVWKYSSFITIVLSVQKVYVTGSCHPFFIICWAVSTRFAELHNETKILRKLAL